MKVLSISLFLLGCIAPMFAQETTTKVVLQKGDKIVVKTDMQSKMTQSMMGGEPTEIVTNIISDATLEVMDLTDKGYVLQQTLTKVKMDFNGFGQSMTYDSDSKEKSDNPFVKSFAEKIGKPESHLLGFNGKQIEEESEKKEKNNGGGKGMMRMLNGGMGARINAAFLVIPEGANATNGWMDTSDNDGLKTIRKFSILNRMGSMVSLNVLTQTKGEVNMNQQGMEITSVVNTTSEETWMVNAENGRVLMQNVQMKTNNKTIMNDKESPSTGTTTIQTNYE
jgi:hypothetical protein